MRKFLKSTCLAALGLGLAVATAGGAEAQQKILKMQATWPASLTLYENFQMWVERVDKLSGGTLKIEAMPAGAIVPAFEVLDATHKKVIDGAHAWGGYWTGKDKTSILFTGGPGGTFGMDFTDYMGWMYFGGG
jgi:TRAP-type mannitol/chloroaromatic compound transport system substrate-binding protein